MRDSGVAAASLGQVNKCPKTLVLHWNPSGHAVCHLSAWRKVTVPEKEDPRWFVGPPEEEQMTGATNICSS